MRCSDFFFPVPKIPDAHRNPHFTRGRSWLEQTIRKNFRRPSGRSVQGMGRSGLSPSDIDSLHGPSANRYQTLAHRHALRLVTMWKSCRVGWRAGSIGRSNARRTLGDIDQGNTVSHSACCPPQSTPNGCDVRGCIGG